MNNKILYICFALLAVSIPSVAERHRKDVQEIPFHLYRNHLIVATGKLGPLADRNLLIDTGANPTIIDESLAYELGLKPTGGRPGAITTVAGVAQIYYATLATFDLGPIHRDSIAVAVANFSLINAQTGLRIDAIVGLDAIEPTNFQIDYLSRKIQFGTIHMPSRTIHMVPNKTFVVVAAQLNSTELNLMIDTGSSQFVLFRDQLPAAMAKLPLRNTIPLSNVAGDLIATQVQLNRVRIGNTDLSASTALLANVPNCCEFQGMLGISALQFRRVSFDFQQRVLGLEFLYGTQAPALLAGPCRSVAAANCEPTPSGFLHPR